MLLYYYPVSKTLFDEKSDANESFTNCIDANCYNNFNNEDEINVAECDNLIVNNMHEIHKQPQKVNYFNF